jgi:hypothetical protein
MDKKEDSNTKIIVSVELQLNTIKYKLYKEYPKNLCNRMNYRSLIWQQTSVLNIKLKYLSTLIVVSN